MKKEPSFLLSPTLGIIKVFSNNYPVYFLFLLCYNVETKGKNME